MANLTTSRGDGAVAVGSSRLDELARVVNKAIGKLSRMSIVDRSKLAVLFEQDHLRKLLAELEVDCVFDVGANVGQYARMLRQNAKYKGRIVSFEPLANEFEKLKNASKADALWHVERAGITSHGGTRTFNVMRRPSSARLLSLPPGHRQVRGCHDDPATGFDRDAVAPVGLRTVPSSVRFSAAVPEARHPRTRC